MSTFCLVRDQADKFIKGLRSGEIDPLKLSNLSSAERNAYLGKFVGEENAAQVNSLFESKLLLKNQQQGMITWAKNVAGLKPEVKKDIITRIGKLDRVLNPEDQKAFLHDLASTKIGADVTQAEAKQIFELSNKVKDTRAVQQEDLTFKSEADRLDYGRAKQALINYVNDLKSSANGIDLVGGAKEIPGIAKSIKASLDDSAIFRQGWKTMFTHPLTWQRNARQSFVDIVKQFGGKKVMDELNADIISRPNYDRMVKAKLAIGTTEEAYPSSLPEKIPVLGRAFKASETAYTGFLYRQRADIFDKYLSIAEKAGRDINNSKELQSIGSMVNSLTGRGDAGILNNKSINNIFFSPRNIKSQLDTLLHPITGAGGSNFVRKEAAINLVKVIGGIGAIMTVANAVKPGSAELDPRSSDFGKIRVNDTRFDISGGMASMVTLAARLGPVLAGQKGYSKSSTTGKLNEINARDKNGSPVYGSQTGWDVLIDYGGNKLSPVAAVLKDVLKDQDFNGNKPTLKGEAKNLLVPLPVTTFEELKSNPNSANIILSMIADGLGIATNTYSAKPPKAPTPKTSGITRSINRKVR